MKSLFCCKSFNTLGNGMVRKEACMMESVGGSKEQLQASLILTQRDSLLSTSPLTFADPSGKATSVIHLIPTKYTYIISVCNCSDLTVTPWLLCPGWRASNTVSILSKPSLTLSLAATMGIICPMGFITQLAARGATLLLRHLCLCLTSLGQILNMSINSHQV